MTSSVPSISVVVCTYNERRWRDLSQAVSSLQKQTVPAREIIVVVDHNPALLERVRQELTSVVAVENKEARGLSGARNSGIAIASSEVIAFLDDDEYAGPDWLKHLGTAYHDPQVLGVGGAIKALWLDGRPGWFPDEFGWVVGDSYHVTALSNVLVRNLFGGNMSFRREVFEDIGGFCTSLGLVGDRSAKNNLNNEDTEICIRLAQRWPEAKLIYQSPAVVGHKVRGQSTTISFFIRRCYVEGISKAYMSKVVGNKSCLSTERAYTMRLLPSGFKRGLADTIFLRDLSGVRRAAMIVVGLASTMAGFSKTAFIDNLLLKSN